MGKYVIYGGNRLYGDVYVQGAKNAILPLFAAAIMTKEKIVIENCPDLVDVHNMANILKSLGAKIERYGNVIEIDSQDIEFSEIPCSLAKELRSSIFLLGSILGRLKKAKVAYPGGCDIGLRPIDIHLKGLRELNVDITEKNGYIYCDATRMCGANVDLDYPSVGATENVILAAALAEGVTTINNAAREPEIFELQQFLNKMGAKVKGAGTSNITIQGVKTLNGTSYTTMSDRIVAGTLLIGVAMCGGEVCLHKCNYKNNHSLISKLAQSSCKITTYNDKIEIISKNRHNCIDFIETQPYPGFPTDLQAQIMALQTVSSGTCLMSENIFETRFKHVPELIKMGAKIKVNGRTALIRGVQHLNGAEVSAGDLRGGASLVLAGLKANGKTVVNEIHHIDRGYEALEDTLTNLGANIVREQ